MGRTVASVSVDATGVGMQGERGAQADGRMVWVGKVFDPRTEPSEAFPKPHPGVARYQAGLMDLEELEDVAASASGPGGHGEGRAVGGADRRRQRSGRSQGGQLPARSVDSATEC